MGSEHTVDNTDFAICSWYQLTPRKIIVLDRNHRQGKRNMVKTMRISKEFKSIQETSTFSLGKSTHQYSAIACLHGKTITPLSSDTTVINQVSFYNIKKIPLESLESKFILVNNKKNWQFIYLTPTDQFREVWKSMVVTLTAFTVTNKLCGNDKSTVSDNKWRIWNKLSFVYSWHSVPTLRHLGSHSN